MDWRCDAESDPEVAAISNVLKILLSQDRMAQLRILEYVRSYLDDRSAGPQLETEP